MSEAIPTDAQAALQDCIERMARLANAGDGSFESVRDVVLCELRNAYLRGHMAGLCDAMTIIAKGRS